MNLVRVDVPLGLRKVRGLGHRPASLNHTWESSASSVSMSVPVQNLVYHLHILEELFIAQPPCHQLQIHGCTVHQLGVV